MSFKPLLKRIVQSPTFQYDVENAVAERFGISIFDAIRLVCAGIKDGSLRIDERQPGMVIPP